MYIQCHPQDMTITVHPLESCISDVSHWMAANRLKRNTDKTELLWAGSKSGSAPLGSKGPPLRLGSEVIAASDHVRLLGVTVSSDLSLQKHVSFVCLLCASTGSARFAEIDDLLTLSPRRLLCTRSSRLVLTTATLSWLVHRRS